eukprot:COSAG06_NODE_37163_length_438_cov_1.203540_1_plen_114_part_01
MKGVLKAGVLEFEPRVNASAFAPHTWGYVGAPGRRDMATKPATPSEPILYLRPGQKHTLRTWQGSNEFELCLTIALLCTAGAGDRIMLLRRSAPPALTALLLLAARDTSAQGRV